LNQPGSKNDNGSSGKQIQRRRSGLLKSNDVIVRGRGDSRNGSHSESVSGSKMNSLLAMAATEAGRHSEGVSGSKMNSMLAVLMETAGADSSARRVEPAV
jgi:hypothetical protein